MREIKFRGRTPEGRWRYGNYIHSKRFEGCFNVHRIHNQETGMEIDIIPETISQFTGKYDKNGKEIYEGDVLEVFTDGDIDFYQVKWDNERAIWGLISLELIDDDMTFDGSEIVDIEVVEVNYDKI